jgi:RNA polymerase sigma-70 factor (ECF subfamily)
MSIALPNSALVKKTDTQLVSLFKKGSIEAYEELISRYSVKAFSLATRLTKSHLDAEEVLQDVFTTVFRKIKNFQGKSSFSSWFYRITVNASFMKLRKRKQDSRQSYLEELPPIAKELVNEENESGDDYTLRREVGLALEEAISKLPREYKAVFVLRDVDGLSSEEVSKILRLTIPAIKSRLHRSRLMVKRKLLKFYREYAANYNSKGDLAA